jgi:D-cysteine desulfhydrase
VDPTPADNDTPAARPDRRRGLSRRGLLRVVLFAGVGGLVVRTTGYRAPAPWPGHALSRREGATLAAAAEALLPDVAGDSIGDGPTVWEIARNVDEYALAMPPHLRRDVHALLFAIEHLTPLGGRLRRFTRLAPATRARLLEALGSSDTLRPLYRGMRDLVMLGFYQDQRTWPALGYEGPTVGPCVPGRFAAPRRPTRYASLVAPPGELPAGAR